MAVVRLSRGKDVWELLVPDASEDEAREWAETHANGGPNLGGGDMVIPSNGRTKEQLTEDRRAVRDQKTPKPLTKTQRWEIVEVSMDEVDWAGAPERIAAAELEALRQAELDAGGEDHTGNRGVKQ